MISRLACTLALVCFSCSSGDKKVVKPNGNGDTPATPDAGATSIDPDAPITTGECVQLFRHILSMRRDEMRDTKPANEVPTDEQIDDIVTKMSSEEKTMTECKAQPRTALECGLAAKSVAAFAQCAK